MQVIQVTQHLEHYTHRHINTHPNPPTLATNPPLTPSTIMAADEVPTTDCGTTNTTTTTTQSLPHHTSTTATLFYRLYLLVLKLRVIPHYQHYCKMYQSVITMPRLRGVATTTTATVITITDAITAAHAGTYPLLRLQLLLLLLVLVRATSTKTT